MFRLFYRIDSQLCGETGLLAHRLSTRNIVIGWYLKLRWSTTV